MRESKNRGTAESLKQHIQKLEQLSDEEEIMEAYLSMQQAKEVRTEIARNKVWFRIGRESRAHQLYTWFSRAAAILVFPLLLLAIWGITRQKPLSATEMVTQEVTVPMGIRSRIVLPDSTRVWLNSGSSVRYRSPFVHGKREIILSGEAYFEVTHDQSNPFSVHTGRSKVEVLGTSFNVKAYDGEPDVEVVLIEGKLRFMADVETEDVILSPGERAVFEKNKGITVSREPLEKYAAWRFGRLVFDETPMKDVARDLERWFGIKVILTDPGLNAYRFTTTFEDQSLQQVLELLELSSPIKARYEPGTIGQNNQPGQPAKIYFSFETIKNSTMTR